MRSSASRNNKLHLKSWDFVCCPKQNGGLGFGSMHNHNLALLTKTSWNLATEAEIPCVALLKAKYLEKTTLFSYVPKARRSYFWMGICNSKILLQEGKRFIVGSRTNTDIWASPWVPNGLKGLPIPRLGSSSDRVADISKVSQPIDANHSWNIQLLLQLFPPPTIADIIQNVVLNMATEDRLVW